MSIEERVKKIIVEQLGVKEEDVKPEASFVEDLGFTSSSLTPNCSTMIFFTRSSILICFSYCCFNSFKSG